MATRLFQAVAAFVAESSMFGRRPREPVIVAICFESTLAVVATSRRFAVESTSLMVRRGVRVCECASCGLPRVQLDAVLFSLDTSHSYGRTTLSSLHIHRCSRSHFSLFNPKTTAYVDIELQSVPLHCAVPRTAVQCVIDIHHRYCVPAKARSSSGSVWFQSVQSEEKW